MEAINLYQSNTARINELYASLKVVIESTGVAPEGNCMYYHNSFTVFPELINKRANLLWAAQGHEEICEIGFNAGHSAALLALPNNASITFFDIAEHPYVEPCFQHLCGTLPNKMELIKGDSRVTLPDYLARNGGEQFDLIHVDGGHQENVFVSDFACALKLAKKGALLIVDDTNIPYISAGVDAAIKQGLVEVVDVLYTIGYEHRIVRRV
jgi:hypothetical protein